MRGIKPEQWKSKENTNNLIFAFSGLWRWNEKSVRSIQRNLVKPPQHSMQKDSNSTFFYFHHWIEDLQRQESKDKILSKFQHLGQTRASFDPQLSNDDLTGVNVLAMIPHPDAIRYASQWESIKRCVKAMDEMSDSDIVIRMRLDSFFPNKLPRFRARRIIAYAQNNRAVLPLTEGHSSLPVSLVTDQFMISELGTYKSYADLFGLAEELVAGARKEFCHSGEICGIENLLLDAFEKSNTAFVKEPVPFVLTKKMGDGLLISLKRLEFILGMHYCASRAHLKGLKDFLVRF